MKTVAIILSLIFLLSCANVKKITKSSNEDSENNQEAKIDSPTNDPNTSEIKQNIENEPTPSEQQIQPAKELTSSGEIQNQNTKPKKRGLKNSVMKLGGWGNKMVGGVMENMGKGREETVVGKVLTKGGQVTTAVGTAAEDSADNNKGVGEAMKSATKEGGKALFKDSNTDNMSNQKIIKAQELLISKGYTQGSADGIMGKKTVKAIKNYQKDNGLPITGKLDVATCKCMDISEN